MFNTPKKMLKNIIPSSRAYFFREDLFQGELIVEAEPDEDLKEQKNYIFCRTCYNIITESASKISVQGSHKHVFFNPMGIVFEIGCFSYVYGVAQSGSLTYEFTWFDGYAWNICLCSSCYAHIGWYYQSTEGSSFFGLILSQLEEGPSGQ